MSSEHATQNLPLSELLALIIDHRGKTPKKLGFNDFYETGIPVLSAKHVKTGRLVETESMRFSSPEMYKKWMPVEVKKNDIIMTSEAPMGEVFLIETDQKYLLGQRVFGLRANPEIINPKYLATWLSSNDGQQQLISRASGTTVQGIRQAELLKIKVPVPTKTTQNTIANISYSILNKIELNRKTNETLEAMARTLFQAWFVDFEPVRAKMEGRWKRGQSLPGLPAHLYDLFPDRLVESEQGEIPKGWRISKIGDEVSVCDGGTPSTKEPSFWQDGTHCWATPKDLSSLKTPILMDTDRKITDKGLAKISSGLLPEGTVLLSSRAPIGYLAITETQTAINQGFIAMICSGTINNLYTLFWCQANMEAIVGRANGSTFQEISKSSFREIPIITPSSSALDCYQAMIRPLYSQLVKNEKESCFLAQLRDTLLPRLMSGELRIPDAERIAQKAL